MDLQMTWEMLTGWWPGVRRQNDAKTYGFESARQRRWSARGKRQRDTAVASRMALCGDRVLHTRSTAVSPGQGLRLAPLPRALHDAAATLNVLHIIPATHTAASFASISHSSPLICTARIPRREAC